jgi:alkylation response protein AidB-like acyl-CoA dehydrogenase
VSFDIWPYRFTMTVLLSLIRPEPDDLGPLSGARLNQAAEALAQRLEATAVERDRQGGHAALEREAIRESGLLTLTVPREHGGGGADWATFCPVLRRLAQSDSALAHVFGFHHLQIATVRLFGDRAQQVRLLRGTVEQRWFWGNALNPLDKRAVVTETVDGGFLIDGSKSYSSGSVGSDQLIVSGWHEATQSPLVAALPTGRTGVTVLPDWDAFGQRQTDSGTVRFDQVRVDADEVLQLPGAQSTPIATLRTLVSQLIMANLYASIAVGAFETARRYTLEQSRPWPDSGVTRAADEPYIQHRYAGLWLLIKPALVLADLAAARLDAAWRRGAALTAAERGEVAVAVAEAKVLAHRAAMEVSSQMFELVGARATSQTLGLDRFWRNARVHTLHDPVDQKLRDIGRHLLDGRWPEPGSYS